MTDQNDLDNFELLPEQGSFVVGLTLGLVAGAGAFFLFGTERGGKFRKQLTQDWESAKETMADEGVLEDAELSLREFLQNLAQEIFQSSIPSEILTPTRTKRSARSSVSAKKAKRGSAKFSGV